MTKSLYIMKNHIKTIIKAVATIVACIAFILMFGERPDGSICLPWTLGCLATFTISAKILDKMGVFGSTN